LPESSQMVHCIKRYTEEWSGITLPQYLDPQGSMVGLTVKNAV